MQKSDLIKKIAAKKKQDNLDKFLLMCTNPDLVVSPAFKKAAQDTLNEMLRIDEAMKKLRQEERNTNRFLNNLMQNDSQFFENISKLQQQLDALNKKETAQTHQTFATPPSSTQTPAPVSPSNQS